MSSPCSPAPLLERLMALSDSAAHAEIRSLQGRLRAGELRVILAGEAKRGKSTLGNALVGRGLLPAGVTPVTALPTVVREGIPERLEVEFRDGRILTLGLGKIDHYVTQQENPANRLGVSEVRAFLPDGFEHIILVDTPGIGSVFADNGRQTATALESMDLAVFVLTADAPMSASEAELLGRLATLSVEVLVVLNKVDVLSDDERDQARAFVADSAAGVLGETPVVYTCSGRRGLAAREVDDQQSWSASGLADLEQALLSRASAGREETLESSIAAAAFRLGARQLDEVAVRTAALRAVRRNREDELVSFSRSLEHADRHAGEARDLLAQEVSRQRRLLDAHAAREVGELTRRVRAELDTFLDENPAVKPAELADRGRALVAESVERQLVGWRDRWQHEVSDALSGQRERQQELLLQSCREVAETAERLLGVRLRAAIPELEDQPLADLVTDFGEEIGWNHAVTTMVRYSGPRARARVARYLREEARRLADKHLGRARASCRQDLDAVARDMQASLARAFEEVTSGVSRAEQSARALNALSAAEAAPLLEELTTRQVELAALVSLLGEDDRRGEDPAVPGSPDHRGAEARDHPGHQCEQPALSGAASAPADPEPHGG